MICMMLWSNVTMAFVPSQGSGRMNAAVGSIVKAKLAKIGSNVAATQATIDAIAAGATTAAVGIATGAVTTVGWPALLIAAGVSGVVSGAVSFGVDGLLNWLWPDADHPKQVQISGTGMGTGKPSDYAVIPGTYPAILEAYGAPADVWYKASTGTGARHIKTVLVTCPGGASTFCGTGTSVQTQSMDYTFSTLYTGPYPGTNGYWSNVYRRQISSTTNPTTVTYQIMYDFLSPSGVTLMPPGYVPKWDSPESVTEAIPEAQRNVKVSDKMLADLVNVVWKRANAQDPNVVPWPSTSPVTPSDIADWKQNNPEMVPTIDDYVGPVAPPGAATVPIPAPGTTTPNPVTPGDGTKVDLGPDPNVGPPTLEGTPTAQQIVSPFLNLMPDLRAINVADQVGVCPKPSFQWNATTYVMESHCTLLDSNRGVIEAAMLLVWTIAAVIIVLRA